MNITEQVTAVREAEQRVTNWSPDLLDSVVETMPLGAHDHKTPAWDWCVTVALLQQPWEHPVDTGHRLNRYMTLHTERWNATPTMRVLRRRGAFR